MTDVLLAVWPQDRYFRQYIIRLQISANKLIRTHCIGLKIGYISENAAIIAFIIINIVVVVIVVFVVFVVVVVITRIERRTDTEYGACGGSHHQPLLGDGMVGACVRDQSRQ